MSGLQSNNTLFISLTTIITEVIGIIVDRCHRLHHIYHGNKTCNLLLNVNKFMSIGWPSGLRRYVQVVVSQGAWVRIPLLSFCGFEWNQSNGINRMESIECNQSNAINRMNEFGLGAWLGSLWIAIAQRERRIAGWVRRGGSPRNSSNLHSL